MRVNNQGFYNEEYFSYFLAMTKFIRHNPQDLLALCWRVLIFILDDFSYSALCIFYFILIGWNCISRVKDAISGQRFLKGEGRELLGGFWDG